MSGGHRCRNCGDPGHRSNRCNNDPAERFCEVCFKVLKFRESSMCYGCYEHNGRIGRDGRHIAHCSFCGGVRHNVTTCPEAA